MRAKGFIGFIFLAQLFTGQTALWAQNGVVVEAGTNEPLPFTTLQWVKERKHALADLDGKFVLPATAFPNDTLVVSLLGYQPRKFGPGRIPTRIELDARPLELNPVEILPGENPALRIVRQVIAARDRHNPEKLPYYQYNSYNKVKIVPLVAVKDTIFKNADLMVWESVTERTFYPPNQVKEKLVGSKISGLPGQALPFSPTDIQDLSFYSDWVKVLGKPLLSPIAQRAPEKYRYAIADTAFDGKDTVFTITFEPLRESVGGFAGNMQVHTDGYALQSVKATAFLPPEELIFRKINVRQLHQKANGRRFPYQLDADIEIEPDGEKKQARMMLSVRSYLKNIRFDAPEKKEGYDAVSLEILDRAAEKSDTFWQARRHDTLSVREKKTYRVMDSLTKKSGLGRIFAQTEKILDGRIGVGPVDIDLKRIYDYNRVEKSRVGLGLFTNDRITRAGEIGGWFGYGFGDKKWKYGGSLRLTPFNSEKIQAAFFYEKNLTATGGADYFGLSTAKPLYKRGLVALDVRNFFLDIMDYVERSGGTLFFPSIRNLQHGLTLQTEYVRPAYAYMYQEKNTFRFTELIFATRWAPGERFIRKGKRYFATGAPVPIIDIRFTNGFNNLLDGGYAYQKYMFALTHAPNLYGWGKLRYQITGGIYNGTLPYPKLYVFCGNDRDFVSQPFSFNTMQFNRFTADRFVTGRVYWTPRNVGFPSQKYSPDLTLSLAGGWGTLSGTLSEHKIFPLEAPTKGYYESGVSLTNIFPPAITNILASLRFIGVGLYYRMGPYSAPKLIDNFYPKLEFNLFLN